jgi:tetratricopeptide (TPR) repeat protein
LHAEKELANAMIRQGDTRQALPHLLKLAQLASEDVWTHANIGASYASQHRIADANKEFENVVRLTAHGNLDPVDQRFRSTALLNLGFAYIVFKDYPRALMEFQAADQCDPLLIEHAIASFEQSLAVAPKEDDYLKLFLLLRAKGDETKALSILHQSVRTNPEYASARELLKTLDASPR